MRLNVVFEIHHVFVGLGTLEGKNVGVLAINLNAGRGHVDGLHAESGDGHNGDDGKHERENQPLVFPQDQQIVVEVGFARGKFKAGNATLQGDKLDGAVGAVLTRHEFVFVGHC